MLPGVPQHLKAASTTPHRVILSWMAAHYAWDYLIYRVKVPSSDWTQVGIVTNGETGYTDTQVEAGAAYEYRVKSRNVKGDSDFSDVLNVTTPWYELFLPVTHTGTH